MHGAHALRRERKKAWALEYLGNKCAACNVTDGLEFDHIIHGTKSFSIAGRLTYSKETLKVELDKCQLLCHDCHRKKTKEEKGNTSYKLDWDTVEDIKSFLSLGRTPAELAELYGISPQVIRSIKREELWKREVK